MSNKIPIDLKKIKSYLAENSSLGIEIDATNDADLLTALAQNKAFPNKDIDIGKISVATKDDKSIEFNTDTGKISFHAGIDGSAFAGLGVYQSPVKLVSALDFGGDEIVFSISSENEDNTLFTILRWGYDVEGEGQSRVALASPLKAKFGSDGKREALFAVIRRFPANKNAKAGIKDTACSWRIPSTINGIEDFNPGTWLVTEVESKLNFKLGAQYGYDFDWVKEAKLGGLSGDIGLRLQTGVEIAVGMHLSGRFALILARDSGNSDDKKIRMQLFKLRKKGWNFALDSGVNIQADSDDILPDHIDDFVKAVFGVHGEQVIQDLKEIEKLTDSEQDIQELLYGVGSDYAKDFLEKVTGINLDESFDQAKEKMQSFIEKWDKLDHKVATRLWEIVENDASGLDKIKKVVENITELNDAKAKEYIERVLSDVDFYKTTTGRFLIDLVPTDSLLSTLTDSHTFGKLQENAEKVSDILDGGDLQKIFEKLQEEINERLNLEKIQKGIDETDLNDFDDLLKAKLKNFLGEDNLTINSINEVRATIDLIIKKREEFYNKTIQALNKKYEFSLNSTYQKTSSNQALLDIVFDFSKEDSEETIRKLFKKAIRGDLDEIFIQKHKGIKLNTATLTHEIERQSSVEISLPFYKSTTTHINKSLSKVDAIDEDEGRLLIYELGAKDVVRRKNQRISTLSIGGYFTSNSNNVNVFSDKYLNYSYSLRQYQENMRRADLEYQLFPYVQSYFDSLFNDIGTDDSAEPFTTWLGDIDQTIDRIEPNGKDNFGNTFLSLDISLPSEISSAWLKAPIDKKAPEYMQMSRNIQAALKEVIPFYYLSNTKNFKQNRDAVNVLLAYSSIPVSTYVDYNDREIKQLNTNKDYYWNWPDLDLQVAMVSHRDTVINLSKRLYYVYHRLKSIPNMSNTAKYYDQNNIESIISELKTGIKKGTGPRPIQMMFYHLFYTEKAIIKGAYNAARNLAKFIDKADTNPTEAVKVLSKFGSEITETFNINIKTNFGGDALHPLGTLIFIEAAKAFDQNVVEKNTRAMLDLIVLKKSVEGKFLEKKNISLENIILEEKLIS